MPLIQPQWVEGSKFSAGDAIVSEPVDALRENVERTYQTRYRTLWGSCPILTASLDEARATVRTSVSSSGGMRVTAYATGPASADVTIETLDGVDSETVTLTWAAAGVQTADISEAWITSDTRYRVTVERVSGTIAAVEVCELDGEAEEMAGISTVWADVSTFANLPTLNLRVGDLCITTDTGYRWEVQSLGPTVWEIVEVGEVASISALPASDVREGATATIKDDAWTYKSGSWSSPPITISSWASRPRGSSSYDGQFGSIAGQIYRYFSSAGPGEWIDARVWASATYRAKIVGDVVPASETPAWTEAADGGGSISTDGTRVRFNGQGAGTGARAFASLSHAQSGASVGVYVCGYMTASGTLTGQGVSIWAENGVRGFQSGTGNATGNGWLLYPNLTGTAATAGEVITSGSERWIELVADANGAQLWVNHKLVGWRQAAFFDAVALTRFLLGEISSATTRVILDVRDVACFTYTI